jgi:hypothetical protein
MTYQFWRLREAGPDNLGLACTDDGLRLGQTPLIEGATAVLSFANAMKLRGL